MKIRKTKKIIKFSEIQNSQKFSADLEFCSKGIDPSKFIKHQSSRFFNIIVVLKTAFFEIVYISSQQGPFMQTTFLFLTQLLFYIFYLRCLFKDRIFRHKNIQYANLVFETVLLLYFMVCMGQAWCKTGLGMTCTAIPTRRTILFSFLIIMVSVLIIYFLYMMWNIYLRIAKPEQASRDNEISLPEDYVEVIWEDDSAEIEKQSKPILIWKFLTKERAERGSIYLENEGYLQEHVERHENQRRFE